MLSVNKVSAIAFFDSLAAKDNGIAYLIHCNGHLRQRRFYAASLK